MTLVALTVNNGFPILIGDVYVSETSDRVTDEKVVLPTYMEGLSFNDIRYKPFAMMQKIYIINPNLCVGLAGRLDQVTSFLRAIKIYFKDCLPSVQEIGDFIKYYDKEKSSELSAIVVLATPQSVNQYSLTVKILGECLVGDHDKFGRVFAIGSGSSKFVEELGKLNWIKLDLKSFQIGEEEQDFVKGIFVQNLGLIGRFLTLETGWAETLSKGWGCGFEVVSYHLEGFKKLDELTTIILAGQYDKDTKRLKDYGIRTFMKYKYIDEAFVIHTPKSTFTALEVDKEPKDYKLDEVSSHIDFNSLHTLIFYIIGLPDGYTHFGQIILVNGKRRIEFKVDGNLVNLSLSPLLRGQIEKEISDKYNFS